VAQVCEAINRPVVQLTRSAGVVVVAVEPEILVLGDERLPIRDDIVADGLDFGGIERQPPVR
jgi:hypothetical protein